jgi:hypothetical protein
VIITKSFAQFEGKEHYPGALRRSAKGSAEYTWLASGQSDLRKEDHTINAASRHTIG